MNLTVLQSIYGHPGPYASVCIDVSRDAEQADKAIEVRWRNARAELADHGAAEDTLDAVEGVVGRDDHTGGPRGQILFATGGEVIFDALVAEPPQEYSVRMAPLPDPIPLLYRRTPNVPYVVALADSVGADLFVVDARGRRHPTTVDGDNFPTHKPHGGAEQEKKLQRNVDEQLKANQKLVAAEAQRLADAAAAELIIVAGDPGPREMLVDVLADRPQITIVAAETGHRAAGFTDESLQHEIGEQLREHLQRQQRTVVAEFEHQRGIDGRATEGIAPVIEALREGLVETVLWNRDSAGDDDAPLFVGPRPEQLGLTEQELSDLGVLEAHRVDRASAIVRAAAGIGAGLQFVTADAVKLADDIGAVLRGNNPSLPS